MLTTVDRETLLARIAATDPDVLSATAADFQSVSAELADARARTSAVGVGLAASWTGVAAGHALDVVTRTSSTCTRLVDAFAELAAALRQHAAATRQAKVQVSRAAVDTFTVPSLESAVALSRATDAATSAFHDSEIRVRDRLWDLAERAPGGLPLPVPHEPPTTPLPARPGLGDLHRAANDSLTQALTPQTTWQWRDATGAWVDLGDDPPTRWDPDAPLYGLDEDGRPVPAYQAQQPFVENPPDQGAAVPSVGALIGLLARAGTVARPAATTGVQAVAASQAELRTTIQGSYAWRERHIDPKIRQWYRLDDDEPVPVWMKEEYLRMITESGATSQRVFDWSVKSDVAGQRRETYAVLLQHPGTGRHLVHQYYRSGDDAGQFASAFIPNPAQLSAMFRAMTVTS